MEEDAAMKNIPDDCFADEQYIQAWEVAKRVEIAEKKNMLKELEREINEQKITMKYSLERRKFLKQLIASEREKLNLADSLLPNLLRTHNDELTKLALLKEEMDDESLKHKAEQLEYQQLLENCQQSWEKYQAEYEQLPLAIVRKEAKIELQKLKVELMMMEYKKKEFEKMLEQIQKINKKKMQRHVVNLSQLALDIWKEQEYTEELAKQNAELEKELEETNRKCEEIKREEKIQFSQKLSQKQPLSVPKLNSSEMKCYIESTAQLNRKQPLLLPVKIPMDYDTMSVNTIFLEEMCHSDDDTSVSSKEKSSGLLYVSQNENHNVIQDSDDPKDDSNVEKLETVCRQLSITERRPETLNKDLAASKSEQDLRLPKANSQLSLVKKTHSVPNSLLSEEFEPKKKVAKYDLNVIAEDSDVKSPEKKAEGTDSTAKPRELPRITNVEVVSPNFVKKIPSKAVPETPNVTSKMFSTRHYEPSVTSSDNVSNPFDISNIEEPQGLMDLDCSVTDMNADAWQNFSPPIGSEVSFTSATSAANQKDPAAPANPAASDNPSQSSTNQSKAFDIFQPFPAGPSKSLF